MWPSALAYQWNGSGRWGKQNAFGRSVAGGWTVFAWLGGEMIVVFGAGLLLPRGGTSRFLTSGGLAAHGDRHPGADQNLGCCCHGQDTARDT